MKNNTTLVELCNVSKSYDNGLIHAVVNVSLTLKRGKIYVLSGSSGSGKSTLLNMIGTIDAPSSGTILYKGKTKDMLGAISHFRRDFIGFVFQFHHLIPVLTLGDNVEVPMLSNPNISSLERRRKVQYLLELMGIDHKIDAYSNAVSGGERQRGAIARALANDPELILADEPTGNIDSKTTKQILIKLREYVKKTGGTILIATHDNDVTMIADTIIAMEDGKIISVTNKDEDF